MSRHKKLNLESKFKKNNKDEIEKLKRKKINLLPSEFVKAQKIKTTVAMATVVSIAIVIFLSGVYMGMDREIKRIQYGNEKLSKEIEQLEGIKSQQEFLESIDKKIGEKRRILKEIEEGNFSMVTFFMIWERNIPKDIGFINLTRDQEGSILINGSAASETSVAQLLHNLKSENIFEDVFISNINKQSKNNASSCTFSLVCRFRRE